MPANPTTQEMGERHEVFLAELNGGVKTRASGSQWHDQGDGRDNHDEPFAFCYDGKSTRGKGITVTLDMIAKIRDQSQGERPQIALRWYGNDMLDVIAADWIAVQAEDFRELKQAARRSAELEAQAGALRAEAESLRGQLAAMTRQRDQAEEGANSLRELLLTATGQRDTEARNAVGFARLLRECQESSQAGQPGGPLPGYVPSLPWTVIRQDHADGRSLLSGTRYGKDGTVTPLAVTAVHV